MGGDKTNSGRRRFLTAATTVVGAVGTGFVLVPFISSMQPSAKARAAGAPVRADISKLEPGQMIRGEVAWQAGVAGQAYGENAGITAITG